MDGSIDGIMCRMKILNTKIDHYNRLYYELYASRYERDTQVDIFEWVISDKPNGEGHVYYRKSIHMLPYNEPEEIINADEENVEFLNDDDED